MYVCMYVCIRVYMYMYIYIFICATWTDTDPQRHQHLFSRPPNTHTRKTQDLSTHCTFPQKTCSTLSPNILVEHFSQTCLCNSFARHAGTVTPTHQTQVACTRRGSTHKLHFATRKPTLSHMAVCSLRCTRRGTNHHTAFSQPESNTCKHMPVNSLSITRTQHL